MPKFSRRRAVFTGNLFGQGQKLKNKGGASDDSPNNRTIMKASKVLVYSFLDNPEFGQHFLTSQTTNIYQHRFPRLLGADSSARELKVDSSITSNHNLWKPMKKGKRDSINLENIDSSISRVQSRNANIRVVIEISLCILTFGMIFYLMYLMKLSLQRCFPVRNTLKRGGYLVASTNYVPKRVPIDPNELLKPTSPVLTFSDIDLFAEKRNLLVMPPNPYIKSKSHSHCIAIILALRGGALLSSETWAYLTYAASALSPYAAQLLVNALAFCGHTQLSRALQFVLLIKSTLGFSVGPNKLGSLSNPFTEVDQLDQIEMTGRTNDSAAVFAKRNDTDFVFGAKKGQIDRKQGHYFNEYSPGESRIKGWTQFVFRMTLEATQIYFVSFNEKYKKGQPGIATLFMNATHNLVAIYIFEDPENKGIAWYRTIYNITKTQFKKWMDTGRIQ